MHYNFRIALLLCALCAFCPTVAVCAQEIVIQKCDSYITLSDKAYERIVMEYMVPYPVSQNGTHIYEINYNDSIKIPGVIQNVHISDSVKNLTYISSYDNESDETLLEYASNSVLRSGDRYKVTVEFDREVEKPADNYAYLIGYRWKDIVLHLNVFVKMNENYKFYNSLKAPNSIFSDESDLILHWVDYSSQRFMTRLTFGAQNKTPAGDDNETNEKDITGEFNGNSSHGNKTTGKNTGGDNECDYNFFYDNITVKDMKSNEEGDSDSRENYISYIILIFLLFFAVIVVFLVRRKFTQDEESIKKEEHEAGERKHEFAKSKVEETLTPVEIAIVDELRIENDLTQIELCRRTGIAKSTMSRTIDRLEKKGIAVRMEEGMSKKVRLVKWMV